jgi:PAS domain S-box-containing protein
VTPGPFTTALRLAAIAAVYYMAGRLGLSFAFVNASASAIWPPTGIAVASLLLYGLRCWPAVFVGAFLVNLTTASAVVPSTAIACGNTIEAVLAAWFIQRYAGGVRAFDKAGDIFRTAAFALVVATPLAASVGTLALVATQLAASEDIAIVWATWWLGDAAGAVTVTPLVLLWTQRPWFAALAARPLEGALLGVTLVGVTLGVFGDYTVAGREHWELAWLCLPVLLWAALRFGPKECVAGATVVSVLAIRNTLAGSGPFSGHPPNHALLILQCFISILMLATLATAAEARERRARERELELLNRELEERVQTRTADLARAQDHLEEAQHIARLGSWEWDINKDRVSWSDELYRIYGLEPATFVASYDGFLARVHPDDVEPVRQQVTKAVTSGERMMFEHRIVRPDGSVRIVAARADVVRGADGRPVRLTGTAQDVTDQRRAEEERAALAREHAARVEAEEANRAKDQFLATLSHELRTPLNAVLGWSHMLLQRTLDEGARERAIESIYRNATIQNQLVSDMLDISRMTGGDIVLTVGVVDLPSLVEAAVEAMRPAAVDKEIELVTSLDETAWIEGDAKRLSQVLNNLLNNAIKFTPPGGQVAVDLQRAEDQTILVVRDTGPGIPPEFLPHVFDRFAQADVSVTRAHGGLGLGLAIVRHIIERHGGRVTVGNVSSGTGAIVTARLPALTATRVT